MRVLIGVVIAATVATGTGCDEPCEGYRLHTTAQLTETEDGQLLVHAGYYATEPNTVDPERCYYQDHEVTAISGDERVPLPYGPDGYEAYLPDDGRHWQVVAVGVPGTSEDVVDWVGMPGDFTLTYPATSFRRSDVLELRWDSEPPPSSFDVRIVNNDLEYSIWVPWQTIGYNQGARLPSGTLNYIITDGSSVDLTFVVDVHRMEGSRSRSLTLRSEP